MTRLGWTVFLLVLLLIVASTSFFFFRAPPAPVSETPQVEDVDLEGQSIYVSGEYGFSLRYPSSAHVEETFSPFYHVGSAWRLYPYTSATGTPLISIVTYETKSENSFPRYFDALVRIGVSTDTDEVKNCEKSGKDTGETALPDRTINGTTWKVFSFQDAGMMQYVRGVSYRVVHEKTCVALEALAAGSSYRDDPVSENDIPQEKLDAEYAALDSIVETFTFSTP